MCSATGGWSGISRTDRSTATDLGLGALFFALFQGQQALMDALGVPPGYHPIGAIAVGYATAGHRSAPTLPSGRRPLDQVVRWEGR